MPNTRRQDQLGRVIAQELSELMRLRVKDPRIGFASITGVNLSRDLSVAKVYISVMGSPDEQRETMRGLRHAAGFLRHELAQRLSVRHVPEITFVLDESIARGARMLDLLNQISHETPSGSYPETLSATGAVDLDER
ncbi:MAG TPA: 30S ribosome-binding factor RbfA [Ktedonobacterales bacterium]